VVLCFGRRRPRISVNVSVRFVADNELQVTEAVRDDPMMSSAAVDLGNNIRSLEFVTKAPKFLWSDILQSLGLVAAEILQYFS
jgi:hypothetical protein